MIVYVFSWAGRTCALRNVSPIFSVTTLQWGPARRAIGVGGDFWCLFFGGQFLVLKYQKSDPRRNETVEDQTCWTNCWERAMWHFFDTSSHLFSRARRNKENNMFTLVCLKMRVLPVCPQTLFLIETNMINLPAYDEDFHHHCIVVEVPKLSHKWFRGMTLLADRLYSGWLSWATCSPSDSVELSKMAMKRERERVDGWNRVIPYPQLWKITIFDG